MNITTLINNIRDALTSNSAINAWCQSNYSQAHTVYKGLDDRNPPGEDAYPIIHLFPVSKNGGYQLSLQDHVLGVSVGIHDLELSTSTVVIEDSIRSTTYKWTASGSGTNEYYCEIAAGGDPSLNEPDGVYLNDVAATAGTAGDLSASKWDWGDNDTLGYSTVYVRLSDGSDPDGKTAGYVEAIYNVTLNDYDGVDNLEAFRKLVETAIVGATLSDHRIDLLTIEYETVEFFPFFLSSMEFKLVHDFSQGDDPFR